MDTKKSSTNGNGHEPSDDDEAPSSAWPQAERTIRRVTDPDLRSAFVEGLERQRELLAEVHRVGGDVSDAMPLIMRELGAIRTQQRDDRVLLEGVAARVARLDKEGEITREEMRDVRKSADNWRLAADESTQRAILASERAAEATSKRAETSERLRVARQSHDELVPYERRSRPVEFANKNKKLLSAAFLVVRSIVTWLTSRR